MPYALAHLRLVGPQGLLDRVRRRRVDSPGREQPAAHGRHRKIRAGGAEKRSHDRPGGDDYSPARDHPCVRRDTGDASAGDEDALGLAAEMELDADPAGVLGHGDRRAHRIEDVASADRVSAREIVGEPRLLAQVDLLASHRRGVRSRVFELLLLDREEEHRPRLEVERHGTFRLQPLVDRDGVLERILDPAGRLAKQEPAVSPRRARADPASLDDENAQALLREEPRRRTTGEAGPDDDRVGGQLSSDGDRSIGSYCSYSSVFDRRLRQKATAPTAPTAALTIATRLFPDIPVPFPLPLPLPFPAARDSITRFATGFPAV